MEPKPEKGYPTNELLNACGGEFLSDGDTRVVKFGTTTYCEGQLEGLVRQLDDERFEARGQGRPNQTQPLPKPEEYS